MSTKISSLKTFNFAIRCFRCAVCNSVLKTGNFSAYEGKYYCKPHFTQLFKMKGSYNSIAENTPDDGSGSNPPTPKGPQVLYIFHMSIIYLTVFIEIT